MYALHYSPRSTIVGVISILTDVTITGCSGTAPSESGGQCGHSVPINSNLSAIRDWLLDGPQMPDPSGYGKSSSTDPRQIVQQGSKCAASQKYHARGSTDQYTAFDPNASVLWPGALVQTKTAASGILDAVSAPRAPLQLTLTGASQTSKGTPLPPETICLPQPSASAYETARRTLVGEGFLPSAVFSYAEQQMFSFEQACTELGIDSSWIIGSVRGSLSQSSQSSQSKYLVRFTQRYYTVAMDPPQRPEQVFAQSATVKDLQTYSDPSTNPIGYISEVTYGRQILMTVSSDQSAESLKGELEASIDFVVGQANGSFQGEQANLLNQADVRIYIVGDDPTKAVTALNGDTANKIAAVQKLIASTPDDTLVKFGVPISYRINYLRDNRVQRLALASDVDINRTTSDAPSMHDVRVTYYVNDDDKNDDTRVDTAILNGEILLAQRTDAGQTWDDQSTQGPLKFDGEPIIPLQSLTGATLRICDTPSRNDTFRFNVTVSGVQSDSQSYTASFRGLEIKDKVCQTFNLPSPSGSVGCL